MAFKMSNKAFEEVFGNYREGTIEPKAEKKSFYEILRGYLRGKKNPSARIMLAWMKRGGVLCALTCRADVVIPLMEAFRDARIPYMLVEIPQGDIGVIIRQKDTDKTKKCIRSTLKAMAQTCDILSGTEAEMHYLRSNHEDKMMLQIAGLTREEVLHLAETGSRVLPKEAVGMDVLEDGTYMLTCHGKTAMTSYGKNSFGAALTETLLVMNGQDAEEMRQKEKTRAEYLKAKSQGFPDRFGYKDDPVWIVGNGNRYVKKEHSQFELGHADGSGQDVSLIPDMIVKENERRYDERFESALSKITGHVCLYSYEDALDWFRTKRDFFDKATIVGQQQLAEQASAMVSAKIRDDKVMTAEGKWDTKLRHYTDEMKQLLAVLNGGRIPDGYKKEDIEELGKIAKAYSLDMRKMMPAFNRVAELSVYGKDAGPQRVADIQKHIERMSTGLGRDSDRTQTRTQERSSGSRTR